MYKIAYKYNELNKETIMNAGEAIIKNGKFYIKIGKEYIEEKIKKCKIIKINLIGTMIETITNSDKKLYICVPRMNIKGKFLIINLMKTLKLKKQIDNCIKPYCDET